MSSTLPPSESSPIILYGMKISLYTGKARSYLIKQGLPFVEQTPVGEHFEHQVLPQIGRRIIPVIEMPDGTLVQDTTDIIDYLEGQGLAKMSAYPQTPLHHITSLVLELFGNEGLIRQAMHYRWNFAARTDGFITHGFVGHLGAKARPQDLDKVQNVMNLMQSYLPGLGVTPQTIPVVEAVYEELLGLLDTHFRHHPYFLGGQPTIGDYGMLCSLYAHLGRDPVPASLMKNKAPALYRWTERMNVPHADLCDFMGYEQTLLADDQLPETLLPILEFITRYFLPEMIMHCECVDKLVGSIDIETGQAVTPDPRMKVIGFGEFDYGEHKLNGAVRAIRLYLLSRITDYYASLSLTQKSGVESVFDKVGLRPLLDLKPTRRIERQNHQEVWGELT